MLALTGNARRWEPKRLRLRLFAVAGRLARGGRRLRLRLAERWPWAARDHRRDHPPAGPPVRLTSRNHPDDQEGETTRARGTPPTRRDSRAARHGQTLKISHQPMPQATASQARKIEASERDEIEFAVPADGTITVRGHVSVPSDQAWFFTPEGLAG